MVTNIKMMAIKNCNQMKQKLKLTMLILCISALSACKKEEVAGKGTAVVTAKEFSFNMAIKAITPDEAVNGDISSGTGIKQIYGYLVRSGKTDSLIYSGPQEAMNQTSLHFVIPTQNYASANLEKVAGIKLMIRDMDNGSSEGFVKVTSFSPPMPTLKNIPTKLLPDENGKIRITGTAASENGIKEIAIYDDYQGIDALVEKIDLPNREKTYELNYTYTYRKNASRVKVVITDLYGLSVSSVINMPLLSYNSFKGIEMMANGTTAIPSASSFFTGETGTAIGSCNVNGQEQKIDFVGYCTSTFVYTLYSPANTSTISKNFKCGSLIWEPNTADLKATKFRVLVPGTAAVDQVYAAYNANLITELSDAFFNGIPVPAGNTAKFDAIVANQSTAIFNLSSAYLIWIRVPKADGLTFTNQLLRVKEVNIAATAALSTIKFDILVSK